MPVPSQRLFGRLAVAFDCETTGLNTWDGAKPFMWTACDRDGWELMAYADDRVKMRRLSDILADPEIDKVAHNAKFDVRMALHSGLKIRGRVHDTMVMATLVNEYEPTHALKPLARKYLGASTEADSVLGSWFQKNAHQLRKRFGKGKWKRYDAVPKEIIEPYALEDPRLTLGLFHLFSGPIETTYARAYIREMRFMWVLLGIEERGHAVDFEYFLKMHAQAEKRLKTRVIEMQEATGVKGFSPAKARDIGMLFKNLGVRSPKKTPKGGESWDKEALGLIDHPIAKQIQEWRELAKLDSTYYLPLALTAKAHEGIIRPTFWQTGSKTDRSVVTGRLSSSDPNFQNIPRRDLTVRRGFVPRPGHALWYFDYKQIEMVLFAVFAQDQRLISAVVHGVDLHDRTAELLFGKAYQDTTPEIRKLLRQVAKTINFGIIYGMGIKKFVASLIKLLMELPIEARIASGIMVKEVTDEKAKEVLSRYHRALPSVSRFMRETMWRIGRVGYLEDPFGRRYHVPSDLRYKGVNALIQGCAANVMKEGVLRAQDVLDEVESSGIVNLVHDEVQLEVALGEEHVISLVRTALEDRESFPAPILVDVATSSINWASKHPPIRKPRRSR